jgi:hypothetical protein
VAAELGELVEEEDAVMGEAHLRRARDAAAEGKSRGEEQVTRCRGALEQVACG